MIEIQNLYQKSKKKIVNLLLDEQVQPFEICVPKSTRLFHSEKQAIAIDYAKLAYSGQLLSTCAQSFDYEAIKPHLYESALFQIRTNNIEELANALFKVSFGYVNDPEDEFFSEETFYFDEYANQFLYEIKQGIREPACKYFYQAYLEFLKK
ncbi:MAG TPA: hypothetical protein VF181_09035 [Balneolaceae bacterium]